VTRGWVTADEMTIEGVRDNMDAIRDLTGYIEPRSIADETKLMLELLQGN
jgi:hypothetical protein